MLRINYLKVELVSEFKNRLKELRENKQLSRDELAKAVKLSYWAIAKYEIGERTPDLDTLHRLADFFGVSVDYLLGRSISFTPSWWYRDAPPTDVELDEFLKTANIWFDGQRLTEDDIEEVKEYLRLKWEREKRKRERGKEK